MPNIFDLVGFDLNAFTQRKGLNSMRTLWQSIAFLAILLVPCSLLMSQSIGFRPKLNDSIIWTDEGTWVHLPANPELEPTFVFPTGERVHIPSPPGSGNHFSISGDKLFVIAADSTLGKEKLTLFRHKLPSVKGASSNWDKVGDIETKHGLPVALYALEKSDYYLALNWVDGFYDAQKASFAALFREHEGKILFDSCVDMPFGEKKHVAVRINAPKSADSKGDDEITVEGVHPALHPNLWPPTQVANSVILGATRPGILWVFSLSDGQCHHTLDLGQLGDNYDKIDFVDHFLLGMQPTRDQHLWVATRDLDVLAIAEAFYLPKTAIKSARVEAGKQFLKAVDDLRTPLWWDIDAANWKITKMSAPPSLAPNWAINYHQLSRFQFLFDPSGKVLSNLNGSTLSGLQQLLQLGSQKNPSATH